MINFRKKYNVRLPFITSLFCIGIIACFSKKAGSQSTFSIDVLTVGVHAFGNPNLPLYENALDENGTFCAEPGLNVSYEFFIHENTTSFQISQCIFADAAGQMAGFTGLTFRRMFFHKWRSSFYLGVCPALTYRNSWDRLTYGSVTYTPETEYTKNGNWEIRPSVIGRLEYDIYIGNHSDLNFGIFYGHSFKTFAASLGYRYWISTKVKNSRKCNCKDKYKKRFLDWF